MSERGWLCAGLVLALTVAGGCGGAEVEANCREQEECTRGNDQDVEACIVSVEGYQEAMDEIGCREEYDAYRACLHSASDCRSVGTGEGCLVDADCEQLPGTTFGITCVAGACVQTVFAPEPNGNEPCAAEGRAYTSCL